ncbi:hypothetical protein OPT61_g1773 [Boeremia exigua]|uniref:Uncharacterized protein n=1 Tax=Boeremia exigua TaxID=749465 RepID=A0ACC2IP39_9PLEO|nr:hypothetical protein OPT61_g1773 [Boeremia exigua]
MGAAQRVPHRHREADRLSIPSILDCQTARAIHLASLPNAQAASAQARAAQGPSSSAASADHGAACGGAAALLTANSTAAYASKQCRAAVGGTAILIASGCSGQAGARCVALCLHQEAAIGAQGTQRPLQHRKVF